MVNTCSASSPSGDDAGRLNPSQLKFRELWENEKPRNLETSDSHFQSSFKLDCYVTSDMRNTITLLSILIIIHSCSTPQQTSQTTSTSTPTAVPSAMREFRAAWVATVANINWPSKPGLSVAEQQREAIELLDFLKNHNFNAVIFQVRPQADALYKSDLEPWSYYLSGEQGKAPEPFYDPLEYWINAAHERGLELHVWLNPYRAHHVSGGPVSDHSLVKKKPELVYFLKEGYWWFDPSMKGTQDHSAAVVRDLVKRYDLDGVHFDDYFYPYPTYNKNEDFPDSASYYQYQQRGGKLSRSDWRRDAVNTFIKRVYDEIKEIKPHVKFGLSPFGIWKPGYPESISGFDQHEVLYADARKWLNEGWIDYFAPQLYWPINRAAQSFPVLLGWWANENKKNRHLWPGINVGRDTAFRSVNETLSQIMITRGMVPQSKGVIHWSIFNVTKNPSLAKALIEGHYRQQALVPASPWLDNTPPSAPEFTTHVVNDSTMNVVITQSNASDVFHYVVYSKLGNNWTYKILNQSEMATEVRRFVSGANNSRNNLSSIRVTAVDRVGNESVYRELNF